MDAYLRFNKRNYVMIYRSLIAVFSILSISSCGKKEVNQENQSQVKATISYTCYYKRERNGKYYTSSTSFTLKSHNPALVPTKCKTVAETKGVLENGELFCGYQISGGSQGYC